MAEYAVLQVWCAGYKAQVVFAIHHCGISSAVLGQTPISDLLKDANLTLSLSCKTFEQLWTSLSSFPPKTPSSSLCSLRPQWLSPRFSNFTSTLILHSSLVQSSFLTQGLCLCGLPSPSLDFFPWQTTNHHLGLSLNATSWKMTLLRASIGPLSSKNPAPSHVCVFPDVLFPIRQQGPRGLNFLHCYHTDT